MATENREPRELQADNNTCSTLPKDLKGRADEADEWRHG